jgi:hypothetical protein
MNQHSCFCLKAEALPFRESVQLAASRSRFRHASEMPARRHGIALNFLAAVCVVIAIVKRGRATVTGAYMDQSADGSFSSFAIDQPNILPWLAAALLLLALGTALLVARR